MVNKNRAKNHKQQCSPNISSGVPVVFLLYNKILATVETFPCFTERSVSRNDSKIPLRSEDSNEHRAVGVKRTVWSHENEVTNDLGVKVEADFR